MNKIFAVLLFFVMIFTLFGCSGENSSESSTLITNESTVLNTSSEMSTSFTQEEIISEIHYKSSPEIILNGEKLDTYTLHYRVSEDHAAIPLTTFLMTLGAEYADSPLNEYGKQCYTFMGKRFLEIPDMHLFMLEKDYEGLRKELEEDGIFFSRDNVADKGLVPRNKNKAVLDINGEIIEWGEIYVDHFSIVNALNECGIDIKVEHDYENNIINVTLPNNEKYFLYINCQTVLLL